MAALSINIPDQAVPPLVDWLMPQYRAAAAELFATSPEKLDALPAPALLGALCGGMLYQRLRDLAMDTAVAAARAAVVMPTADDLGLGEVAKLLK